MLHLTQTRFRRQIVRQLSDNNACARRSAGTVPGATLWQCHLLDISSAFLTKGNYGWRQNVLSRWASGPAVLPCLIRVRFLSTRVILVFGTQDWHRDAANFLSLLCSWLSKNVFWGTKSGREEEGEGEGIYRIVCLNGLIEWPIK